MNAQLSRRLLTSCAGVCHSTNTTNSSRADLRVLQSPDHLASHANSCSMVDTTMNASAATPKNGCGCGLSKHGLCLGSESCVQRECLCSPHKLSTSACLCPCLPLHGSHPCLTHFLLDSTFSIPFSRSASYDDNLAFFKEVLAELHR